MFFEQRQPILKVEVYESAPARKISGAGAAMSAMAVADPNVFMALRTQLRGEVAAVRQELLSQLDRLSAFEAAWTERLNLLEGHATQPELPLVRPRAASHRPRDDRMRQLQIINLEVLKDISIRCLHIEVVATRAQKAFALSQLLSEAEVLMQYQSGPENNPWWHVKEAYDKIKSCKAEELCPTQGLMIIVGCAMKYVREYLVIRRCYGVNSPIDYHASKQYMMDVLGRPVDAKLNSECMLSYQTACDWGLNQDSFSANISKLFPCPLDAETVEQLFVLYRHCATASPVESKQRSKGKLRPGKKRSRSSSPARRDAGAVSVPHRDVGFGASEAHRLSASLPPGLGRPSIGLAEPVFLSVTSNSFERVTFTPAAD